MQPGIIFMGYLEVQILFAVTHTDPSWMILLWWVVSAHLLWAPTLQWKPLSIAIPLCCRELVVLSPPSRFSIDAQFLGAQVLICSALMTVDHVHLLLVDAWERTRKPSPNRRDCVLFRQACSRMNGSGSGPQPRKPSEMPVKLLS